MVGRIIVYVRGGTFVDVIADISGLQVMLVDYDNEEEDPNPIRSFDEIRIDRPLFTATVARTECME